MMRLAGSHRAAIGVGTALLLALAAGSPLAAGWQYTDWTMDSKAVVEASQKEVKLLEKPQETKSGLLVLAAGEHKSDPFRFDVFFLFRPEDSLLERVSLQLINKKVASQLYQALVNEYGAPVSEEIQKIQDGESHKAQWKDEDNNNLVFYFGIGKLYVVEYAPISRGDGL